MDQEKVEKVKETLRKMEEHCQAGEVTIGVYLPEPALRRAFALDLPRKVKSKVLSSIIAGPSNPGKAEPMGEWGETWGETPQD